MSRSPNTLSILLGAALAAGCMGDPQLGATYAALEDHDANPWAAEPLETAPYVDWVNAPAGCEGQVEGVETFRRTEDAAELVGAVNLAGMIVCVDSLPAIQAELDEQGREDEAEELGDAFAASMRSSGEEDLAAGDPTPQPNSQATPGDPTPQPNSQATPGDPTPQPNSEADAGDPTPQPNSQATPGDPTPQPNTEASAGDPHAPAQLPGCRGPHPAAEPRHPRPDAAAQHRAAAPSRRAGARVSLTRLSLTRSSGDLGGRRPGRC